MNENRLRTQRRNKAKEEKNKQFMNEIKRFSDPINYFIKIVSEIHNDDYSE